MTIHLAVAIAAGLFGLAGTVHAAACANPDFRKAAAHNADSLTGYHGPIYSVTESGWQAYVPQIQKLIGSDCTPDSEGFAASVAAFQTKAQLPATGQIDRPTLTAFRVQWQKARTIYAKASTEPCPFTGRDDLVRIRPDDDLGANDPRLAAEAYAAWQAMRQAAIADGVIGASSDLLKFVAAYRSPERAAELKRRNPNSAAQGLCSVHISGFAADLNVGHAPGYDPISSKPANRLWQSRQPVYLWLVANAARFGFVNYVYEPWHWEYSATAPI